LFGRHARRSICIAAAAALLLALPAAGSAGTPSVAGLRAENANLAQQSRSAVLDLYALDEQLAGAQAQLDALHARESAIESQRADLKVELRFARIDARLSQDRLASRIRFLYEHGTTSTLEIFFGARSLEDAFSELDDIDRVASVNDDVLHELRTNESRLTRIDRSLTREQLALDAETQQATDLAAQLTQTRDERQAYVVHLESQRDANLSTISSLEAQAQAAELRSQALPVPTLSPVALASAIVARATSGAGSLTVSSTGYSLPGHTATGLPVGWGVVAVDPSVIPLGTHLMIPGYGEAVAADTGSAVIGDDIDLWFPTIAQADAWGRRTVTIDVQ
jgi:3D (Asp-Asp-Asp) domain-containing protein/cell division protein FtsB